MELGLTPAILGPLINLRVSSGLEESFTMKQPQML